MKLYFSPGSCSLAPHIILLEAGLSYSLEKTDLRTKTYSGGDFKVINPKGSVPVIELDDGSVLTENAIILQYLADLKPGSPLLPSPGTWARYRSLEMTNFITTEIHKSYSTLFGAGRMVSNSEGKDQLVNSIKTAIGTKYDFVSQKMGDHAFLMGDTFSIADAYLYTVTRWSKMFEIDLTRWPVLQNYMQRIGDRPSVVKALMEEGLQPF